MASEESVCSVCGEPLAGRDRYEDTCSACREREVLAGPPAEAGLACPACGAENPVGLEHCMACEARLHGRRVHPVVWVAIAVGVVGAVAALIVVARRQRRDPRRGVHAAPAALPSSPATVVQPPTSAESTATPARLPVRSALWPRVREETAELLRLLRERRYERVIDNYLQPDEQEFERVRTSLEAILHGEARAGFLRWAALAAQADAAAARERLRKAGDPQPGYTVAFLTHLAASPETSGSLGTAEGRARRLLAWHVAGLFEGLDLTRTEVRGIDDPGGGPFTVELDCTGRSREPRPGDNPQRLRWVRRPEGWVLRLAAASRLEAIAAFLKRAPAP